MAYGLLIKNNRDEIVIDSNFASLQKLRSGTLTTYHSLGSSEYPRSHTPRFFPYTPSSPNSLLFMKPAIGQMVSAPIAMSDLGGVYGGLGVWSDATTPIPFMEIVAANAIVGIAKPGWGLEIRGADGTLLFHSGAELMAVDNFYQIASRAGSDQSPGNPYTTITVGATAWICPYNSGKGFLRISTGASSSQMHLLVGGVSRQSATSVGYNCVRYREYSIDSAGRGYLFPGVNLFTA